MAKPELGTKRIDPDTGKKFYDLGKDPIVSPYSGKSYPRSYFDSASSLKAVEPEEEVEEKEADVEEEAEVVSLEDADEEAKGGDDIPEIEDEEEVDLGEEADVFLEDEEEDDEDVSDIIGVGDDDDI